MAKKIYNNPIDKNINWGGDENTGGLPVSGEMVQKFIKDTLNQKAGIFYYDTANNRYLVFADEESRDIFLLDPTQTELVLGTFDAPFNYSAEITLNSPAYNAIAAGSTGNYVDFTFDIKNKQGSSTGENVTITYTFTRNAIRQTFSETRKYGDIVHLNVDKYLDEGTNTLVIGVTGQTSLAATTASITYQVVSLNLTDGLDISKVYDLRNGSQVVSVPYTVAGYGTKTVEWYLDGEQLPFVKAEDEVADVVGDRTKRITLENLQQGVHSLQIRAYTMLNGEKFYTDTLYRELMVYTGSNENIIIGVALTIPKDYGIFGPDDSAYICNMTQYVPYTLRFATYMSNNASNTPVLITFDGEIKGNVNSSNNVENNFVMTPTNSGTSVLTLSAQNTTRSINSVVNATSMDIYEIDNSLILDFNANGKSNNSADRDSWTYGDYSGSFSGFYWNDVSGWVNGRLEMNAGSSFEIDYAPLLSPSTETGKTIEIEWMTKNVTDDNTIICDLRSANGTGLLITATKVSLISADGVVVETEYKSGENVRVSFVINKAHGVSHQHLSFIYTNGTLSRGESWAASDNYTSNANIVFTASTGAEISLKSIRVYDTALSADNILNNYILYRDTVSEMMDIYDRNNVYVDNTINFSPEKMMSRLPVMIVTGDIPTLENTSDTGTQIEVDIEYYNMQDPSRNFTMKKAAMRPQGTSSMGYPKKNFRIYTQKIEDTQLFDANGQLVLDKMYSFKSNAQPVDCWCLKADYAESSGTHNTGIARLWNDALYNAQVDGEYKLRTEAQKAAKEANYKYDVRTAIDGFPILLFYRPTENSELIFIGKYNFNNDKSTESVFGFTGIPNFNNEKMQCWEILNNGNALALFTSVDNFDTKWSEAFESRYPDTKTPYTGDLKAFCQWMNGVSQSDFATEKWDHLNVYMMAAYWCYLMRHAAADQFVKNAMFTSEDGQHFYFILYDNDTINGLINTGDIRINPTDDRQTVDESGSYVFAGHDSKLWNMLEADEEFQEIVAKVDNALYSSGISYINAIKMFDEEQAGKWVERVYNKDAQYKYIDPYVETGTNNLFMLQGKRDLHRRWWLAKRFSIYDAKYISGTYKSDAIEIKCLNGTESGQQFTIKSGYPFNYGYGINNLPRESKIFLNKDESYTFTTREVVNVGDPIRIYGAPNISELDLSAMSSRLSVFNVAKAASSTLGSQMKKLIVGNITVDNVELAEISGINGLTMLEYLDVQRMKNISSLNLTNQSQMKVFKGFGSGVSSVLFADGAPLERIELPSALRSFVLNQHSDITFDNIVFEDGMNNIATISIKGCPNLTNDFNWVRNWYNNKTSEDEYSSLVMDNVNWRDVGVDELIALTNLSNLSLKGVVKINDITLEQTNRLVEVFGESAFDKNAEFYINAPDTVFVIGRDELLEGESEQYSCIVFGGEAESFTWSIYSGGNSNYTSIDSETGLLTVEEGSGARTLVIRVVTRTSAWTKVGEISVRVKARTYPASGTTDLTGSYKINNISGVYNLEVATPNVTGEYVVTWSLTGVDGYAEIESSSNTQCIVKRLQEPETVVKGTLKATLTKKYNNSSIFSKSFSFDVINEMIAETDTGIVNALYNKGLCANSTYITKAEAALVTENDLQSGTSYSTSIFYSQANKIKTFDGFQYFTGISTIPVYLFGHGNYSLTSITIPPSVTTIGDRAFTNITNLLHVKGGENVNSIGVYNFISCGKLKTFEIPTYSAAKFVLPTTLTPKNSSLSTYKVSISNGSLDPVYISNAPDLFILPFSTNLGFSESVGGEVVYATPFATVTECVLPEIVYRTIRVKTNKSEATSFTVSYTSTLTGTTKTAKLVPNIKTKIDLAAGYPITVSGDVEIEDYVAAEVSSTPSASTTDVIDVYAEYDEAVRTYIQHINGTIYTLDEWRSGGYTRDQANGVVCASISATFTIAKEDASSSTLKWGGYGKTINDIISTDTSSTAVLDYDGVGNTSKIIEQLNGYTDTYGTVGAPAAEACAAYTFPNGNTGYLPALGEWQTAYNNKSAVDSAMALIGGATLNTSNAYWSSVLSTNGVWILRWGSGNTTYYSRNSSYYVRAFQSLGKLHIASNRPSAKFSVSYINFDDVAKMVTVGTGWHNLNIKIDSEVTITPLSSYDGIVTEVKTFIYTEETKEQTFNYTIDNGIFIQHIDGSLYTTEEWLGGGYTNDQANGVAILGEGQDFVIAKQNASSSKAWGVSNSVIGVKLSSSSSTAVLDYDGYGNTEKIIAQLSGFESSSIVGAPAAEACAAYTFPNGNTGYLPALGEWQTAYNNKSAVDSAMALIGGEAIAGQNYIYHWSSTQSTNSTLAWDITWYNSQIGTANKSNSNRVRAFQPLNL